MEITPPSFEDGKKSKYNSALAQLYRLDRLYQDMHNHARNIAYAAWNEDLDRVWMELEDDSSKEDKEEIDKINKKLSELSIYGVSNKLKKKDLEFYSKLINLQKKMLMKKEILLRSVQNSTGKGSAYEESEEDYMDDF